MEVKILRIVLCLDYLYGIGLDVWIAIFYLANWRSLNMDFSEKVRSIDYEKERERKL